MVGRGPVTKLSVATISAAFGGRVMPSIRLDSVTNSRQFISKIPHYTWDTLPDSAYDHLICTPNKSARTAVRQIPSHNVGTDSSLGADQPPVSLPQKARVSTEEFPHYAPVAQAH